MSLLENARAALLAERNVQGHWEGELSTSALSTATAVSALMIVDRERHQALIDGGLQWLSAHQNDDGGWGDTTLSFSNISTTLLVWSAFGLAGRENADPVIAKAETWIADYVGSLEPDKVAKAVADRYGKDRTFSVPILMLCALGGRLGPERQAWKRVLPLPFEIAALPRRWFAILRMPVVSYALPALIAIGYARSRHIQPVFPFCLIRKMAWKRTNKLLAEIQPTTGGFLEATPLTSFVTMALASSGQRDHPVVPKAVAFLEASVREDGSWPIDTNLATWGTTLATKALLASSKSPVDFPIADRVAVRDWLLGQQYHDIHPYTDSPPGGWAWTDLPGGVPDADDTPGAMLALHRLQCQDSADACREAAAKAACWLLGLQNRDGGIPTFCRGFGALPFDRSSPDLTAHTLRAWHVWLPSFSTNDADAVRQGIQRGIGYLQRCQDAEGAWTPLWFGNQHVAGETNRTHGTAQVLAALSCLEDHVDAVKGMRLQGKQWLLSTQAADGGWGGDQDTPTSIEETALALNALAVLGDAGQSENTAIERAVAYLDQQTKQGTMFPVSPIGFYFAKLWYFEKLYPYVWTVEALENVTARRSRPVLASESASS